MAMNKRKEMKRSFIIFIYSIILLINTFYFHANKFEF